MNRTRDEAEVEASLRRLRDDVDALLKRLAGIEAPDVVVGIPFHDEDDTLPAVVRTTRKGLERLGLAGRSIILCIGPEENYRALRRALRNQGRGRISACGFGHCHGVEGPGWGLRTMLEAAARLGSSLVILRPDLTPQNGNVAGKGFAPVWLAELLRPIRELGQSLALARFTRHAFAHPVDSLLTFPIMTEVFGFRLRQPTPGIMALSPRLVQSCVATPEDWPGECGVYGFDTWVVTSALTGGQPICEVPLGLASFRHSTQRLKLVFRQVVHTLMHAVTRHADWWRGRPDVIASPIRIAGIADDVSPPAMDASPGELFRRFKREFDHFDESLFQRILPGDLRRRMERLSDRGADGDALGADEWCEVVNRFLLAYRFETGFHPDDVVDGLFPMFLARLTTFVEETKGIGEMVPDAERSRRQATRAIVRRHAEHLIERQSDIFATARVELRTRWDEREREAASYLPRLGVWEFVPHIGVMVPHELEKPDGGSVWASQVYQDLIDRYRREFLDFLRDHLGLGHVTDSATILKRVHEFMKAVERALEGIFPHDLTTLDGPRRMAEFACQHFARRPVLQLTPEAAREILTLLPPNELILYLRCKNVGALLAAHETGDALAMAAWSEPPAYLENVLGIIAEKADDTWVHERPLAPVVVPVDMLGDPTGLRGLRPLARLTGRLIAGNLQKGWGGEYPTLWYLLQLVHDVVATELFTEIGERLIEERVDFGKRLVASIRGHWGRHPLSAHHIFKNRHQRIIVERLQQFAAELEQSRGKSAKAGRLLGAAMKVYNLSITLPDDTFVPLSAWTWTSYSIRGGLGAPTPLSSLVERDWASTEFLTEYITRAGKGDESTIYRKVLQMIGEGRESDDVSHELLGVPRAPEFTVRQTPAADRVTAGTLTRPVQRPILEPIEEHGWESRYVLNAGALRIDGTVYILYRAFGDDKISRIGLAWTRDGVNIDGRLPEPIFEPADPTESAGTEDPRVTIIDDRIYMLYTAYDGRLAQIAMASIPVEGFLDRRFDLWERHGLGFPGVPNKDAVIYPEKFDGRWVIYHRLEPNMWVSYLGDLTCPWPRTGQKIVTGPRPGMMWDGVKIGAGAQPLKTTHGWLNIYHGVDYARCYRLGVLLMALDDPARVLYKSPNAILEPELDFEIGNLEGGDYWVPKVVFTCGAVPARDTDVIGPDDEILVYYGAADTAIGVAKGRLRDIVPLARDGTDTSRAVRRASGGRNRPR